MERQDVNRAALIAPGIGPLEIKGWRELVYLLLKPFVNLLFSIGDVFLQKAFDRRFRELIKQ